MRNLIHSALPAACALLCAIALPAAAQRLQVQSPDARTQVEFTLRDGGVPSYRVLYRNKIVLDDAPLGLDLGRANTLGKAMTLQGSTPKHMTADSNYPWARRVRRAIAIVNCACSCPTRNNDA